GAKVNASSANGVTPLLLAAQDGCFSQLCLSLCGLTTVRLLKEGAKVNAASANGVTPLLLAAQDGETNSANGNAKSFRQRIP
ncbi:hypothetical protein T484DRAFT_1783170, partial [Baffinella frigidus]